MSRKYCEICGNSHHNGGLGRCDDHLDTLTVAEEAVIATNKECADEFELFMGYDEETRWRMLFEFAYKNGFRAN